MRIELEDNFNDILAKAMKGLGVGKRRLAELAGVDYEVVRQALQGEVAAEDLALLAAPLHLSASALQFVRESRGEGGGISCPEGWYDWHSTFTLPAWGEMMVNVYAWEFRPGRVVLFDTGTDPQGLLSWLAQKNWLVERIYITHDHPDHVYGLPYVLGAFPEARVLAQKNLCEQAEILQAGDQHEWPDTSLEVVETRGHSDDGLSFVVREGESIVAVTGDALLTLSIGGVDAADYNLALQQVRQGILSLPDEAFICCGHGPVSTVGFEKGHNPFFAQ